MPPDPNPLQQAAAGALTTFAGLVTVLFLGWLGWLSLGGNRPRPVGGVWRRDTRGRAVCPGCAAVPDPEDVTHVLPTGEGEPVKPGEKCCSCMAYRAEENADG